MLIIPLLSKGRVSLALFLLFILSTGFSSVSRAQEVPGGKGDHVFSQTLKELMTSTEPSALAPTKLVTEGRLDASANIMRAMYRIDSRLSAGFSGTAAQIAGAFLQENHAQFGLDQALNDLEIISTVSTAFTDHTTYQQVYEGIPVYGRFVKVNMNKQGEVTMVLNGYSPGLRLPLANDLSPSISETDAVERARQYLDLGIEDAGDFQLMVYPSSTPRLVWRLVAWTTSPALELEFLIDARDGSFVGVYPLSTHAHEVEIDESAVYEDGVRRVSPASGLSLHGHDHSAHGHDHSFHAHIRQSVGTGLVFDPDPLTSSGNSYGAPFVDNDDTDILEVNQERKLVELLDISQGGDGLYRLEGPHVRIVGESSTGAPIYTPPSENSPDGFRYSRGNSFFESVNAYYHIDRSQRYLQTLDIGRDIQNVPVRVNPHGMGQLDNSSYFSLQNYIAFGLGGVDDGEDALVILHEYGHALLHGSAPGLLSDSEGQALHEGWADYWAGSYARSLVDENQSPRQDWISLFKWDSGDGAIWSGRELTFAGKYPDDVFCDNESFLCDIYTDGLFWASTLMEIYDALGRYETDRLSLASHIYLSAPVSFQDAAQAIVQADADINDGQNIDFLISLFDSRGLISASTFGPVVVHDPLVTTEQLGGTVPVVVEATGISSPITEVFAVYTHPGGITDTLALEAMGTNTYSAQLPLPETPGEVSYYIGVSDELGLFVRDPAGFTSSLHRFQVGPDDDPPVITHNQVDSISLIAWPAQVIASVTDNLGVEDVTVEYFIDNPFGVRIAEGAFSLESSGGDNFSGIFPTPVEELLPGSTVFYRIVSTDASQASNEAFVPETGYLGFNIVIANGLFRSYDFESQLPDFSSTGTWAQGRPEFGVRVAHSGDLVWATTPAGAYPDVAQQSELELPAMNLAGIEQAYLVFWHWYDTEHAGDAVPGGDESAVLWDAGNVKISEDDGVSWAVVSPQGGYNGQIASGRGNPLEGEPGFGGFSFGWRQAIVPIPTGGMVNVRFDFGSDSGTEGDQASHAGWYIDDVQILTELQPDTDAPRVTSTNIGSGTISRGPGESLPHPTIVLLDDTGIESVFVDYTWNRFENENEQSSFRLAMDSTRLDVFSGEFPVSGASTQIGDIITYSYRVSDFDGNTVVYPENPSDAFVVEYRLIEEKSLLADAVPSGLWEAGADTLVLQRRDTHNPVSSLVFGPIELPSNADQIALSLQSTYEIIGSHGGNIKIALDEASEWQVIEPEEGYNGVLRDDDTVPSSMRAQPVFRGIRRNVVQSTFMLEEFAGNTVWIRADFAAGSELSSSENWKIEDIQIRYSTLRPENGGFSVPRDFTLYANFPDPFSSTTTLSYTIESPSPVRLEVYDVLGRHIETLVQGDQDAGTYSLVYDATQLSSGLYFLRLETNQGQKIEKMLVSK